MTSERCECLDDASTACSATDVSADTHENRPGLPAISYRRGVWASVLRRITARLDSPLQGSEASRDARALNTAASDDPAVALLDAFSVVADVLTFYQERIANEGFLRTATERRSVGYLADAIGYRLQPGVAAATDLAFNVDDSDKAPGVVTVGAGMPVMHIPGQDESPQFFETGAELEARAEWNQLTVPTTRAQVLVDSSGEASSIDLVGTATGLRQHSRILIVYDDFDNAGKPSFWRVHRVKSVALDSKRGTTRVTWEPEQSFGPAPTSASVLSAAPKVYAFRTTTALFGWNAPDWHTLPEVIQKTYLAPGETDAADWPLFNVLPSLAGTDATNGRFVTNQAAAIDLAQEHPEIEPGSLVVVADVSGTRKSPSDAGSVLAQLYRVESAVRTWRQSFRLSGHATRLSPSHSTDLESFGLRESAVYAATEQLSLAPVDDASLIGPVDVEVTGRVSLPEGRKVQISGWPEGAALAGPRSVEAAEVESCEYLAATNRTVLRFATGQELSTPFHRQGALVHANVVSATHGKTIAGEVLGSGDGSQPFPNFQLKQSPLTHVSDSNALSGTASTLSVRVNGVEWEQVESLLGQDGRAHVYTTLTADDGTTTIVFGDGNTGSRLPSGVENITATYRIGIGKVGEVASDSIALMVKKPLGMRSVQNLLASSGAEDPEGLSTARAQAPASVLVLGRVVSASDYADFALGFPGVGKAAVEILWDGDRQVVHVTVTDTSGQAFSPRAPVFENVRDALLHWGDAEVPLVVATLDAALGEPPGPRRFGVKAGLLVDPAYVRDDVVDEARSLLLTRFSAEARNLGQHVSAAEVIATLHEVDGVTAVDLDELWLVGSSDPTRLRSCLPAYPARVEHGALLPAELVVIDPNQIVLVEMLP